MKRVLPTLAATALTLVAALGSQPAVTAAASGPLNLSQVPLFAVTAAKPNVLLLLANSNSMDEDPSGTAVGSDAAASKSEIARGVAKSLVSKYTGVINMGLEAFQQNITGGDAVRLQQLHASPYDASYNPLNYNAAFAGNRSSTTKKYRTPNLSSPGSYIYYNVNLPFYSGSNQGNGFCYSSTANAAANAAHPTGFNNGEDPVNGPWDNYRCFSQKTNTSDALPTDAASETAAGYGNNFLNSAFLPTDSDLGQGITDFGRFLAWNFVSPTWFSNGSPGQGYIHIPIASLDSTQAAKFNTKFATSQFSNNGPTNAALPLQNAGLTPLEGSMQTARSYFLGTLSDSAQGGPLSIPPTSCHRDYMVIITNGLPSVQANGTPSSDTAALLSAATTATTNLRVDAGVNTYIIGFALPFGVNPNQLDAIAVAGGTGQHYDASDQATLSAQLDAVFADILQHTGAASAVAINSASAGAPGFVYQAKFDLGWAGQLNAYPVLANGTIDTSTPPAGGPGWQAAPLLGALNFSTGRKIITFKPSNGNGIPFRWPANPASPTATELDTSQVSLLNTDGSGAADTRGSTRLNYLRGDRSLEGSNSTTQFRQRNSVLGDIVNSSPVFVGVPDQNVRDVTYAAFRASAANRTKVVYVGANDGFMHAFDATTGNELLAYMPATVYANISKLSGQNYAHRYFVDGSAGVGDIQFGAVWHTVLASGLGAGGRGIFALDITDPSIFDEAHADTISLWEYNSVAGTTGDPDLGYTFDTPSLVKLNNGQWGAVFGNGYNNTGTGQSGIFILNAQTGVLIKKLLTGVGSLATPNGIGAARVVDVDGNGTADVVYGGDLTGRMWKFDISDPNPANWVVSFSGNPLFTANNGAAEPITSAPEVTPHPLGGYMVIFGTGQYLAVSDPTNTATQSLYGVRDNSVGNLDRSSLVQQTITSVTSINGNNFRTVSTNAINWASKNGWYLDLPAGTGERVAVDPVLRFGRAVFVTLIPNTDPCSSGGTSWLMEVDYLSGGQPTVQTLDTNGDNTVNSSDTLVSGVQILGGIASSATVRGAAGNLENKFMNLSSGAIQRQLEAGGTLSTRRMSWRQER